MAAPPAHRSGSQQGVARSSATWTGAAGWERGQSQRCPGGDGHGEGRFGQRAARFVASLTSETPSAQAHFFCSTQTISTPPLPHSWLASLVGEYSFAGETVDGEMLEGTAVLTHNLPAAPRLIFSNPEAEEDIADPAATGIEWADTSGAGDPAIVRYQVVVEFEAEETGQGFELRADVLAEPVAETQRVTVPPEFSPSLAGRAGEFQAAVLAIEASGHKTILAHEFEAEDCIATMPPRASVAELVSRPSMPRDPSAKTSPACSLTPGVR